MMSLSLIPRSNKLKGSGVMILFLEESSVNNCLGPRGTLGILRVPQGCSGLVGACRGSSAAFNYNFCGNKFGIKAVEGLQYNSLKD